MIFYYMILLSLSWPHIRCEEDINLNEEIFDQIATASETVAHLKQSNEDSKDFEEQSPSISSSTDERVYYENSNGFVPIVPSVLPSASYDESELSPSQNNDYEQQRFEENNATTAVSAQDSSDKKAKKLEEDLVYSSEARIFLNLPRSLTNRRSFDFQDGRSNEFELLKVNNDTPAVANYQEFYKNVRDAVNTEIETSKSSSRRPNGERGKRLENHTQNYSWQPQQSKNKDIYAQFYSTYNNAQNTKKTVYEQEKVADNYQQHDIANYNELSGIKENAAESPSSSRTNYEANEPAHSGTYNAAEPSRTRHRLIKPVVVVEPSNHKLDAKFNEQSQNTELNNNNKILKNLESSSSEVLNNYNAYNSNSRQRSYHRTEDSRDVSDESIDYSDYTDRSRLKAQKSRRRPSHPDSSRKLPKEHRSTLNESAEENKYIYSSRLKSQRHRVKANPWVNDPVANHHEESVEDTSKDNTKTKNTYVHQGTRSKNSWNQISPNIEISHSNGVELDQLERPKYVVNLVPVTNFDHATALGGSQGFDVSNAMLQNIATVTPIGAFSTTAPILSTPQSILAQNLAISKNLVSSPMPNVIVGQNTFQNPINAVLLANNDQSKIANTLRATYIPSTMTPVIALTPSLTSALQSVNVPNMQNNVTPRTTFAIVPQPTIQTYSNILQAPLQPTQIQVNTHGLQGQNLINPGNLQIQAMPTTSTLLSSQTTPEGRTNLASETQSKKNSYSASNANFLATANLAVGQKQAINFNPYYVQNQNTQLIPNQNLQELQSQMNKQLAKNNRFPSIILQTADSATSHSTNNVNALGTTSNSAHLPNIGAKNVEIVNPNMKSNSPSTNTYPMVHYPATVLTTPIPIFNTIASTTPHVSLQSYVNSLTETGTKTKQGDLKLIQSQDRPMFNPINFVPNVEVIKNQNTLNNKLPSSESIQQDLNLVPAMPGGNFFKPYSGQNELFMKPKLASDLQKYAEEMFKESLKTMYNSQKWNNDRRPGNIQNNSEASDLTKLQLELQKLKSSLIESKYRDLLEAHQSQNNVYTTDAPKFSGGKKKLNPLLATLEHILKTRPSGPIHIYHGEVKPGHKPKLGDSNFAASSNYDLNDNLEFLTPPRPGRFHNKPMKKRPGLRYKNGPRKIRPSSSSFRNGGLETSATNIEAYVDGTRYRKRPINFDFENFDHDFRHRSSNDPYSTSSQESLGKILKEIKTNKDYNINHPRMHNLLGLLMKNKQLPNRDSQNYFHDKDELRQFFDKDRRQLQQQFYTGTLNN